MRFSFRLTSLLLLQLLSAPRGARAQGNPCPLTPNATAQRSCGAALCFAGQFTDGGVLQRAPARAAFYGATGAPPVAGAAVALTLAGTLDGGAAYNKTFATTSLADGTWKVLLDPMPPWGSFSATVACAACGAATATVRELTFGDVWLAAGQSNMGSGSNVGNNFWRNASYAGIAAGNYSGVAVFASSDGGGVAWPREELGNWVASGDGYSGWIPLTPARVKFGAIDGFASMPVFFGMKLADLFAERGERAPPIGVIATAVGGTDLAAWAPYAAVAAQGCVNATCMCSDNWTEECPWHMPISNRSQCQCNGMQYARQLQPLLNLTIRGMIFWQGENDCHFDAGSFPLNTGYACTLAAMVAAYREAWSVVPGTTPPDFPFGSVLLTDGSEFGTPGNFAQVVRAQTANFGELPNAAIPNSFLVAASDLGDPWMDLQNPNLCSSLQCCVDSSVPLGVNCTGDHRGQWSNSTPNQSSLHPRTKGLVAERLAQGAYVAVYEPASELLATGPVIRGCAVSGDGSTLTLTFDAALLKAERVLVGKPAGAAPMSLALENTATYILVNASLPPSAAEGRVVDPYRGPYATGVDAQNGGAIVPGNEFGVEGWVAVLPRAGASPNTVDIDLAPLGGLAPTAVRYGLGAGGNGDFLAARPSGGQGGRFCCGPLVDTAREPCPPGSCPLRTSGRLALPAVPFVAEVVAGKCRCLAPQVCDA